MSLFDNSITVSLDFGFIWPIVAFAASLVVSYMCYPVIIRVSEMKGLLHQPNHRSVHSVKTPNLGGIGIFIAINLIITVLGNYFGDSKLLNLLGAMTIMFFVGLVDDLVSISPKKKLLGQVVAALYIILIADVRLQSLHGLLGIYELPYFLSIGLTVMIFLTLMNAYNLIDGVDGLAGFFAITTSIFFGAYYYLNGNSSMFFLSVSMIGALTSFLIFNFSKTKKIFMGDTGSLVVGFLLAYQAVNFMSVKYTAGLELISTKAPIFFLALFSFPLIDTTRVFIVRMMAGKSPFDADKNHIHHVLLRLGLKHWQISLIVSLYTVVIVSTITTFTNIEINSLLIVLLSIWVLSVFIVGQLNGIKTTENKEVQPIKPIAKVTPTKGKIIYMKKLA